MAWVGSVTVYLMMSPVLKSCAFPTVISPTFSTFVTWNCVATGGGVPGVVVGGGEGGVVAVVAAGAAGVDCFVWSKVEFAEASMMGVVLATAWSFTAPALETIFAVLPISVAAAVSKMVKALAEPSPIP